MARLNTLQRGRKKRRDAMSPAFGGSETRVICLAGKMP